MEQDSITLGRMPAATGVPLRDVYDASHGRLVEQVHGVTGDLGEAEHLVEEAFVRAADAERRFRRADDPEAWLGAAALAARRSPWRRSDRCPTRDPTRDTATEVVPPDIDELICRGVRRRVRRRTALAAAAYVIAAVAGAVVVLDDGVPAPLPAAAPVPLQAGLPEVEEVGDRIPPGRAAMPAAVPGARAAVTVEVPAIGAWRENSSGSGIYSAVREGTAWLHLATYVVDGVAGEPCAKADVPVSPPILHGFVRPGPTPAALADAVTDLPRADVAVPPHTVSRWGTTAVHVRVRVPRAACARGNLPWTFDTWRGGELLGNDHARLDFWVVELDGRPLVVEAEQPMGATARERRPLSLLLGSVELLDRESR